MYKSNLPSYAHQGVSGVHRSGVLGYSSPSSHTDVADPSDEIYHKAVRNTKTFSLGTLGTLLVIGYLIHLSDKKKK